MIKGLFKMNNIINMNFKKIYKLISIITIIYAMNACSSPELNSDIQLLDPSKFEASMNYTFTAEFVVDSNGKTATCTINSKAKQSLKKQLKKAILSSQNWQPAAENGLPINEKVTMEFSILTE